MPRDTDPAPPRQPVAPLARRLGITAGLLGLQVLLSKIPLPGVDLEAAHRYMNAHPGQIDNQALFGLSVIALGLGPYLGAALLVELVARYRTLVSSPAAAEEGAEESYRTVSIEWLQMQNPRATFTLERRRLPGQKYPGLGVGRWMVELLRLMAERLECSGLMNIPNHYHNAYLYSKQMLCFNPEDQGWLEAMKRDLTGMPLVEMSEAIDAGRLRVNGGDEPVPWEGKPQVMPVKPVMNQYFVRPGYIAAVAEARERYRFEIV